MIVVFVLMLCDLEEAVGGDRSGLPIKKCPGVRTTSSGFVDSVGVIGREFRTVSISTRTDISSFTLSRCDCSTFRINLFIALTADSQSPPICGVLGGMRS